MEIKRNWHLIDADGKVLGRLSTQIATLLQGKHKVYFKKNIDCGDLVVVTNASRIKVTGKKVDQKIYFTHSGYPGGDKYIPYKKLLKSNPEKIIYLAVKGMLPKNKLRRKMLKRLKIFSDKTYFCGKHFQKNEEGK